jgi:Uma2 family endonuclease
MSARRVMLGWGRIKCYRVIMNAQMFPPVRHHKAKLTVADFLLLNDSGAFENYGKSELLDGEVFVMNSQFRRHAHVKGEVFLALALALRDMKSAYSPMVEAAIILSDLSVPEPDITLTTAPIGKGAIPVDSVGLIVEVADSTQRMDLGKKLRLYAKAQIAEYWVLDTQSCIAHQHWHPKGTRYLERREVAFGQAITAETIADLTVILPE